MTSTSRWRKVLPLIAAVTRFHVLLRTSNSPLWRLRHRKSRVRDPLEDPALSKFLDDIWDNCQPNRDSKVYDVVVSVYQASKSWNTHIDRDAVQRVCAALLGFPSLLARFSEQLDGEERFQLSDDFDSTRAIRIITWSDRKVVGWRAAFGIITMTGHEASESDEKILRLVRSALQWREREEAVTTLSGGDARRTLALLQQLLRTDDQRKWQQFARDAWEEHFLTLNQDHARRIHRMFIDLAVNSDEWPPSVCLTPRSVKLISQQYIAYGGCADIYKGIWQDSEVAVKRLRISSPSPDEDTRTQRAKLYREALIWAKLRHPNIATFHGVCRDVFDAVIPRADINCIVNPWLENGTVRKFMSKPGRGEFARSRMDVWLQQIVLGMQYLHQNDIVHGDLRGANILIDAMYDVKLSDFGVSILVRTAATTAVTRLPDGGTIRWMAPELFVPPDRDPQRKLAPRVDIYAFACTCVELYSNRDPQFQFLNVSSSEKFAAPVAERLIMDSVLRGERPIRPEAGSRRMSSVLWDLVQICWHQKPEDRPTASELLQRLCEIQNVS